MTHLGQQEETGLARTLAEQIIDDSVESLKEKLETELGQVFQAMNRCDYDGLFQFFGESYGKLGRWSQRKRASAMIDRLIKCGAGSEPG